MTADIRTAAQREAVKRTIAPNIVDPLPGDHQTVGWRLGFVYGAEWAAARLSPPREQIAELHLKHWVFDAEFRGTDYGLEKWVSVCDCDWESSVWGTQEAAKREHGEHFADALATLMQELAEGERQ